MSKKLWKKLDSIKRDRNSIAYRLYYAEKNKTLTQLDTPNELERKLRKLEKKVIKTYNEIIQEGLAC